MTKIVIKQMPAFKRAYKKLHANIRSQVDEAIRGIVTNPQIGEEKRGDLASVFVHKFKANRQEMLLAYEWSTQTRTLLALGVHENYYRNLKN